MLVILRKTGRKINFCDIAKFSTKTSNTLNVYKNKDDYYKNMMNSENTDFKPTGWDDARPFESIPGPKPLPVIGNMWRFFPGIGEFYNAPMHIMHKTLNEQYGDVVVLKGIVARKPMILLYDPNDMENVLRNAGPFPIRLGLESFVYYRTQHRKDIFKGVGGVLTVQGEEWFKFRSKVNPILMQPKVVHQYIPKMDAVASELVENMDYFSRNHANNEMPVNFQNELYRWSLESISQVALEERLGCLNRNLKDGSDPQRLISSVITMFDLLYFLEVLPPIWKIVSTPSWRKFMKTLDNITDITMKYIEEALAKVPSEDTPQNELSVLHRLAREDKKVAVAMVMDMLIAGIDTTGKTMAATLYFLAKNPDKQDKLREEIMKHLPKVDSPITKEALENSPYLRAVIKESTRIAPIAIGNLRTSTKDLVVKGYQIPKNTEIISVSILTSNSEEYKDYQKFIPERWLRTTSDEYSYKNAHLFSFMPFGFGPRSCVGKRFANLELEVGLMKIIRNFKLSWPHEDMVFSTTILYGAASPLRYKVLRVDK